MDEIISTIANAEKIAVVGVSDKKFGGTIYKTLKKRGYKVYPVHSTRTSFDSDTCYTKINDLPSDVKTVVMAVSSATAKDIMNDTISDSITHLWFQQGNDFSDAVAIAKSKGLHVVFGKCILMYAEPVTGIHSFHRFLARIFGKL